MASNTKRRDFDNRVKRTTSILTKMVEDNRSPSSYDDKGDVGIKTPPQDMLQSLSQRTASVTDDISSMRQLLPDIGLAANILVSSILSPKDMANPSLSFSVSNKFKGSDETNSKLVNIIEEHFIDNEDINSELSEVLTKILFDEGSYIRLIVPESSIDEVINPDSRISLESYTDNNFKGLIREAYTPLGIFNTPSNSQSLESLYGDNDVNTESQNNKNNTSNLSLESALEDLSNNTTVFLDNPDITKLGYIKNTLRDQKQRSAYEQRFDTKKKKLNELAMEAKHDKENDEKDKDAKKNKETGEEEVSVNLRGKSHRDVQKILNNVRDNYRNSNNRKSNHLEIKTMSDSTRKSYGHPMIMRLSPEAVIPAHSPSDPKDHFGYFIILDQYGNPLNITSASDHYRDMQNAYNKTSTDSNNTLNKVISDMRGATGSASSGMSEGEKLAFASKAYSSIIEKQMLDKLRSEVGYDDVNIEHNNIIMQIMFTRALSKKRTQVLYVPADLVSYMAFDYTSNGIGKSLLEETRILGSLRVMMLFSNTMGAMHNSLPRVKLGIEFDPEDSDPNSTAHMVKDAYMRSRSDHYPLGEGDPSNIVQYLHRAAVDVTYSNHPKLPDMRVEANDEQRSRSMVDRDLEENLRHHHIMGLGLSPETVDISRDVDFATSLVQSSLLLSKRVVIYQVIVEALYKDFVSKFTNNSEKLQEKMFKVISEEVGYDTDKIEEIFNSFLNNLNVNLPRPDTVTIENQAESFENYKRFLEEAIEAYINDDFISMDTTGDFTDYIRESKDAIFFYYLRRWLREKNVFPELEEMLEVDDKGNPLFSLMETHGEHVKTMFNFIEEYVKEAQKNAKQRDNRMDKHRDKVEAGEFGGGEGDLPEGEGGGTDTDTDTGGDLGGDEEATGDEGGDEETGDEDTGGGEDDPFGGLL